MKTVVKLSVMLALLVSGACQAGAAGLCKPLCAEEQRTCRSAAAQWKDEKAHSLMPIREKDRMAHNFVDGTVKTKQPLGPEVRNAQERRMMRTRACADQFATCTKACVVAPAASDVLTKPAGASAIGQPAPLASFRFFHSATLPPVTLTEISREGRLSVFQASEAMADDARALFALCNFAEFAQARGFSHIAVMEPKQGEGKFVLGLFQSEHDDLAAVFGGTLDKARLLGAKPGAIATILAVCPKKPLK